MERMDLMKIIVIFVTQYVQVIMIFVYSLAINRKVKKEIKKKKVNQTFLKKISLISV